MPQIPSHKSWTWGFGYKPGWLKLMSGTMRVLDHCPAYTAGWLWVGHHARVGVALQSGWWQWTRMATNCAPVPTPFRPRRRSYLVQLDLSAGGNVWVDPGDHDDYELEEIIVLFFFLSQYSGGSEMRLISMVYELPASSCSCTHKHTIPFHYANRYPSCFCV